MASKLYHVSAFEIRYDDLLLQQHDFSEQYVVISTPFNLLWLHNILLLGAIQYFVSK